MSYNNGEVATELWAVVDKNNAICWSRGGSSSSPKLMVYPSEDRAIRALNNRWTKQVYEDGVVCVMKIYDASSTS